MFRYSLFFLLIISLSSCSNSKEIAYLAQGDQEERILTDLETHSPLLKSNDVLSITVNSLNPSASEIFNTGNTSDSQFASSQGGVGQVSGYLIDSEGFIKFPVLGKIKAADITKEQLSEKIEDLILEQRLLMQPTVAIRYLNYRISILGEVNHPGVYTIDNEKVAFLEALALAGDLTIYGKRKNITLIRDEYGIRKSINIDITERDFLKSSYYYLKPNDIIYVEPNNRKIAGSSNTPQWVSITIGALSLAVISIATFIIN